MVESVKTRRFGRYQLDRLIGRGGMGEIYLAHMEGAAGFIKPVCIKKILPHLNREKEFVNRFIDEAHIVVTLMHGNIVQVLDMGDVDGEYFIAMEYVPGRDLRDIARRYRKLGESMPPKLVAFVIKEIGKALTYAHKKTDEAGEPLHITHRDVSPSNVLISREGMVKLTDFGIAKAVGKLGKSITGRLQGKFCYMSPEQAAGRSVDYRSDIFSMGTLAYELLTGARPFERDSDLATLEAVRRARAPEVTSLQEDLPEALDAVLAKALARDPDDRYEEASEFARELTEAVSTSKVATEADMAGELSRLFPGAEAAVSSQPKVMALDEALALEVDRMLEASPFGESPTVTADASPGSPPSLVEQIHVDSPVEPRLITGPGPTPTPSVPQFTPTPLQYSYPAAPQRRRWLLLLPVLLVGAVAAVLLWAEPGYLMSTELYVECSPGEAEVFVDNRLAGRCGANVPVRPGAHTVTVRLDGYETGSRDVSLERGERRQIGLTLTEDPQVEVTIFVEPGYGRFSIRGVEDGRFFGSSQSVRLSPGEYEVTAEAHGFETRTQSIAVDAESAIHNIALEPIPEEPVVSEEVAEPGEAEVADVAPTEPEEVAEVAEPERAEHVDLEITVTPEDAEIFVDGEHERTGSGRIRFENESRRHQISVRREGYREHSFRYNPGRQGDRDESVQLEPIPETRNVRIWLGFPAVGAVYVNGEERGTAPTDIELEVGTLYTIEVINELAGREERQSITLHEGDGVTRLSFFQ